MNVLRQVIANILCQICLSYWLFIYNYDKSNITDIYDIIFPLFNSSVIFNNNEVIGNSLMLDYCCNLMKILLNYVKEKVLIKMVAYLIILYSSMMQFSIRIYSQYLIIAF